MSLKKIELKPSYDSDEDDILHDFYIPVLNNSIRYYRLAGYFKSSALAVAARGLQGFLNNKGKMKLIASAYLSSADIDAIKEGIETPEEVIEKSMICDLTNIESEFEKDHVKALAWLVANKRLDIRIAIVSDERGKPLSKDDIEYRGIFHQKIGIFEDKECNKIAFNGSVNESKTAWKKNIEDFDVYRGWVSGESPHLESNIKRFNKFWYGNALRTRVIDVPTAIKKELVRIAPSNIKELNLDKWNKHSITNKKTPRDYQLKAINVWFNNDKRGIFEMATGTGKTYAAVCCIKKLIENQKRMIIVIACPFNHLIHQWKKEIDEMRMDCERIIADGSNPNWKRHLADCLLDIKNNFKDRLIVFTTHNTFSSDDFLKIIKTATIDIFLIVDEVHGIGAPIRKTGLLDMYKYRLGLSATPKRWLDPEGTEDILKYFKDVVYTFSLKEAITTINPLTGTTYLTPYIYKPCFIELTDDELDEYENLSKKIAKAYYKTRNLSEKSDWFNLLCIQRQKIIVNAKNKIKVFSDILKELDEIKYCIVYTSPAQLKTIQDVLNGIDGLRQHKFTLKESTKPEDKYNGISQREYLLKKFAEGQYNVLSAIKCLDEGVDVPQAKIAIILASSSNPRQYIQRRGRILRHYAGKDKAIIYDIIVFPPDFSKENKELWLLERKIIEKEIKRYKEFAFLSLNKMECLKKIEKMEEKFKIVVSVDW
jgi:superfamily II DNA or RNA helicase